MKKLVFLFVTMLAFTLGCSGMKDATHTVGKLTGVDTQGTPASISVADVCTQCNAEMQKSLKPSESVDYTKVDIAEIDSFNESANKVYFSVLLVEKMLEVSKEMNESKKNVAGVKNADELKSLAKGLFDVSSKELPGLLEKGQSLITDVGKYSKDSKKAFIVPVATEELKKSMERLNKASEKLTALGKSFVD